MVRRTKEEALETRNELLDAAERVFNEKGVSRTSLADIAEAAGLTRGAIYWHFRNKADLFDAMMERVTLPLENLVAQSGDSELEDPLGHVRACAVGVLRQTARDARMQRVFEIVTHKCEYVDDMVALKERHLESRSACLEQIEAGFRHAAARGQVAAGTDGRRAAIGLHALIDGLIDNWLLDPAYFDLGAEADRMIDIYLAGLGAGAEGGQAARKPVKARTSVRVQAAVRATTPRKSR
ncbi:MAG: TetR family transcriptional regulator [Betaproteobacteria bacterium]|nr:TetR family transcriptional regulator [Betaproteobacteria bacterium]